MADQRRVFRGAGLTGDRIVDRRRRARVYSVLRKAILSGKIKLKGFCEHCGSTDFVRNHHEDYRYPLEVVELCERCHCRRHREVGIG